MTAQADMPMAFAIPRALARLALFIFVCAISVGLTAVTAVNKAAAGVSTPGAGTVAEGTTKVDIVYLRELRKRPFPVSLLDIPPKTEGFAGAHLAIDDNNTTGRFLKQAFALQVFESESADEIVADALRLNAAGNQIFVADLTPPTLLKVSDALKNKNVLILNVGAPDESLREADCRANIKHTLPSRTMLTDALTQYLTWKRWLKIYLVVGPQQQDKLFADAFRRSAKRFGLKIVGEKNFEYEIGSRRSDGGFEQIQKQIPSFTQNSPKHDVLIVADEWGQFGDYFPYRTWNARPVAGTHGLYPTTWHPGVELWGATQFQNRFKRRSGRVMTPLDYNAWMAVRTIGEAATRTLSTDPQKLIHYIASDKFSLAAFKGQKLSYRKWNGQLRQPIFLTTAKLHVTVSPQPGFLHQLTELDTLGIDEPETKCKNYAK